MKVLIVDDSPDALALAKVRLSSEGLRIVCAESGEAGVEAARRERPDLILLDIDLPDLSGFEVCRALKADGELCLIPVIFLSGSGGPEDKVMGLDLGAVDYVTKPFDTFELRARVNAALRTKRLQDMLAERAKIDPLTGLANRLAMAECLQREWARVQRYGGALSFIMCDVDHFKRVNDAYGHAVGDRALCAIAETLANQCRVTDLACRYGGEEFAIIAGGVPAPGAAKLAERCRQSVAAARLCEGPDAVCLTASFGVADAHGASSPEALRNQADEALLRAKLNGRNRVELHQPG